MKKTLALILVFALAVALFTGCKGEDSSGDGSNVSIKEIPDVDLTQLSNTMVYAEVNNIMTNPDKYVGRTIKMSGPYQSDYYEEAGTNYHFILIEDAAACCTQGLPFVWNGEHAPDDYPEVGTKIETSGVFRKNTNNDMLLYYIAVDEINII